MIKYTGHGDHSDVTVIIYGDGVGASVSINLEAAPFNLNFNKNYPVGAVIISSTYEPYPTVGFNKGFVNIAFDQTLPMADEIKRGPSSDLQFRLVYGDTLPAPTKHRHKKKH